MTEPDVLDSEQSIIIAKDYIGDGNTFKAMDHLMADPVTMSHIRERGCNHPIYRIIKVMRSNERHYDPMRGEHYHILKVHVALPFSPMDYLIEAHVFQHDIPINYHENNPNRRRLPAVSITSAEISNCPRGATAATTDEIPPINPQGLYEHATEGAKYGWNLMRNFDVSQLKISNPFNAEFLQQEVTKTLFDATLWCRKLKWEPIPGITVTFCQFVMITTLVVVDIDLFA